MQLRARQCPYLNRLIRHPDQRVQIPHARLELLGLRVELFARGGGFFGVAGVGLRDLVHPRNRAADALHAGSLFLARRVRLRLRQIKRIAIDCVRRWRVNINPRVNLARKEYSRKHLQAMRLDGPRVLQDLRRLSKEQRHDQPEPHPSDLESHSTLFESAF